MKCPECHFENSEDTLYCGHCGAQLSAAQPAQEAGPAFDEISISQTKILQTPVSELIRGTIFA